MITIDGVTNLESAIIKEAYKIYNLQRVKILIVQLPKTDYSFVEAMDTVKRAKTITETTDEYTTTYYLDGMMTAKEDNLNSHVWMFNPQIVRTENEDQRIADLEQTVDVLLGGEADA